MYKLAILLISILLFKSVFSEINDIPTNSIELSDLSFSIIPLTTFYYGTEDQGHIANRYGL